MAEQSIYRKSVDEVFETLGTSSEGLNQEQVEQLKARHGENALVTAVKRSRLKMFLSQFTDLLVMVLIVAGIVSWGIAYFKGTWTNFRDGSVMFVIVFLNAVIGFTLENKASRIVERLRELIRSPARVRRDGVVGETDQRNLVPGDIVHVDQGSKIPADLRLIEVNNLNTNEFSLTGESLPRAKQVESIDDERALAELDNMAFMGTTVASGSGVGVVVATGMETELGRVAAMTEETEELISPLQEELNLLARRLTTAVVILSLALFGVALWQGLSWLVAVTYALGVAVALVPQALPAQLTVAMASASSHLADRNAVVKNLPSVETLGSTNVICTDKTGTLTRNEMTVTRLWFNDREFSVTGIGYKPEGEIQDADGKPLSDEDKDQISVLMEAAVMASTARVHEPDDEHQGWYAVGDPTGAALIVMAIKAGVNLENGEPKEEEIQRFEFESELKRMSSVRACGDRKMLMLKGATVAVLDISSSIYIDGEVRAISDKDKENIQEINERFSSQALRVLAVAHRLLEAGKCEYEREEAEKDLVFLGLVGMIDPPREGVGQAMDKCHRAHIQTYMITGDQANTAKAIAREIGLAPDPDNCPVVTGMEMQEMDDDQLKELMAGNDTVIFSRVEPAHKLRVVTLLDELGQVVAVTGDGVNDAPALKKAHIGVAMGRTGTDVAKEAARVVLLDDSFPTLVAAVEEGRTIYSNIRKVVLASLTTNVAELAAVLLGLVGIAIGNMAIPILAIQILAIDLLAEVLPLTFLCYDPPTPEVMEQPPRRREEHILTPGSSAEISFLGVLIGVLAVGNFFLFMNRHGITLNQESVGTMDYARASTMTWLTIGYCQFVNILSRRYTYTSFFNRNILTNRILLGSLLFSVGTMTLGVYGPYISDLLEFAAIGLTDWLYVWGAAGIFLVVWEGIKILRRSGRKPGRASVKPRKS